ncbi:lipopolysaccharide core heptosyltransferase RfaQ [bacterium BMS3Bbin06]|nr:lipopolysaccharide core heptosyltransferase RfaQ [bacterium BMS3Abin08]GBE33878.1 lipopolysaccharide core heptosyltransferase RfaQ [bacterium BMS3Bbin06]HDO34882.1 glycosyltransferase family 9 protein [Nitrospirota bacterium]HDY71665.1 glycosyltransferase family 9 protein [Nitrospirota bacterium]
MKEVIIINLTRMGDLIQSTPVIMGLKERYPGVRITLLVSETFVEICKYIPLIDRVFTLKINDIVNALGEGGIIECYRHIEGVISVINDTFYDLAINFTHSMDSAVLTSLIRAGEIRGISIDPQGHNVKRHPWIRYFFNVIPARDYNPFHLCDMHLKVSGVMPERKGLYLEVPRDIEDWVDHLLGNEGLSEGDFVVGLQLGASAGDKRWPVESFVKTAEMLSLRLGAKVVLTGSKEEAELGRSFESLIRTDCLNFIGKTDLKELAALIKSCNLFISNDTGPLHIATAVGTKTINISLASVHFRETGPYGDGHYVIRAEIPCSPCGFKTGCKDPVCKRLVSPDMVYELARMVRDGGDMEFIEPSVFHDDIQVYRSMFDRDGLIEYKPLIRRRLTKEIFYIILFRKSWQLVLDRKDTESTDEFLSPLMKKMLAWYDVDPEEIAGFTAVERKALKGLLDLSDAASSVIGVISRESGKEGADGSLIRELWKNISLIDGEIEKLCYSHPPLKALLLMFRYGMESLEGDDIAALAGGAQVLYNDLRKHARILLESLELLAGTPQLTEDVVSG